MYDRLRRSRSLFVALLVLGAFTTSAAGPSTTSGASETSAAAPPSGTFAVTLTHVVGGLESPTQITNAGDGTNRLFVVEQRGTVRVIQKGVVLPGFFLDIRSKVELGGERGLLGLAFDPHFKTNHRLFVFYTRPGGDIVVSRFTTNAARTAVNKRTARPVLVIEHSAFGNHNGGALAFGPNGYLYIGVGDGGGGGDPGHNAQNKSSLLGKILRINVNGNTSGQFRHYSNPRSNPFAGAKPGRAEIWAYGLRNPWRISFDRGTGRLFIADVGQGRWEEINRERAGLAGGRNYGWNTMEGRHCYIGTNCPMSADKLPIAEYSHDNGDCSIVGGYVYRGPTQPNLRGLYVFGDFCTGRIWTIRGDGSADGAPKTLRVDTDQNPTSFGESEIGELYFVSMSGNVYQLFAA